MINTLSTQVLTSGFRLLYTSGVLLAVPCQVFIHKTKTKIMAIVTHNIVTQGLSGKLGNLLVFRQQAGKTIVSVKPDRSNVQFSAKQKHQNSRFQQAVLYARHIIKDEIRKAAYAARSEKGQSAYHVAIAEYMQIPETPNKPSATPSFNQQPAGSSPDDQPKAPALAVASTPSKPPLTEGYRQPKEGSIQPFANPQETTASTLAIKKVPSTNTLASTAKQRQQPTETTVQTQRSKPEKVQNPYNNPPKKISIAPLAVSSSIQHPYTCQLIPVAGGKCTAQGGNIFVKPNPCKNMS